MKAQPMKLSSERLPGDDIHEIIKMIHRLTIALISPCMYCLSISSDPNEPQPICCLKPGVQSPSMVNVDTCLECTLYKKHPPHSTSTEQLS